VAVAVEEYGMEEYESGVGGWVCETSACSSSNDIASAYSYSLPDVGQVEVTVSERRRLVGKLGNSLSLLF
jgi:hypothetical protein